MGSIPDMIPPSITHVLVLYGAILTAYGLFQMLFGFRLYRVWATTQGVVYGALAGVMLSVKYLPDNPLQHYSLGLVGAGLGAVVFYYASAFAYGAGLGIAVTFLIHVLVLLPWKGFSLPSGTELGPVGILVARAAELATQGALSWHDVQQAWIFYLAAGVGAGVPALLFHRPFLIVMSSMGGAAMAVLGATLAAPVPIDGRTWNVTFVMVCMAVAFVLLTVVGVIVQWKTANLQLRVFDVSAAAKPKTKAKQKSGKGNDDE